MTEETKGNASTGLEIAVIGMAGRFPGAGNIAEFWDNLKNGVETISFFSDEELSEAGIGTGDLEAPNYIKAKGILEGIEDFDAAFFDYRPGEVEKMDPQIRVFHECTWEALESAGYDPQLYKGSIGIYAGATGNINWLNLLSSSPTHASETIAVVQLIDKDFLTTCMSYKFNLKGPSFPIQTACSTSLLAIHLACQGLLSGECDIALAGGVSVTIPKKNGYYYHDGMLFSPDGHNRSFDEKAAGTVFGNGAGVVVLKSLEEAIPEGDTIYAIIKGSAINNDGNRKVGFTAPSTKGQAEVIRSAIRAADIETESIGYIEAHGTGTSMGDPIEIEALKLAFDTNKKGFCRIGSVKSNIGHMDAAAGVIGFIKVVLSLQHRLIPPSLHFDRPNPQLDLENTPFLLNTGLFQWENTKYPLRAGISSFGFGGTNAHVVLEESPIVGHSSLVIGERKEPEYYLILLSAKTPSALDKMTENLVNFLKENRVNPDNPVNPGQNPGINLADAAYTLQVGRSAFQHRRMAVCSDVNEAIDALASPASGKAQTFYAKKEKRPVVFMFPGQGSQYVDMGLELYQKEPVFQEAMDQCFEILNGLLDYEIKEILYPFNRSNRSYTSYKSNTSHINQTEITQPLIFAFEYALAKLLMKWGIKPYAMIGHSIGEYTAACLSGVFSLEDALKLVALRGKLMQKIPSGAMLSVQLPGEELESLLQSHDELSLAAVNTPILQVVSGPHQAVDRFAHELAEKGYDSKRLHTSHAFHSPMMEPILKEFEENVGRVSLNNPQIPYISNVTGGWIKAEEAVDPGYWSTHLRRTIRFSDGLIQLLEKEDTVFVEIGPGRVLSTFVTKHPGKKKGHMTTNLVSHPKEKVSDFYYLLTKIGQLWLYKVTIDWQGYYSNEKRQRISLPTYPFERKRYWKYMDDWLKNKGRKTEQPLKRRDISAWFYIPSWKRFSPPMVSALHKEGMEQQEPRWLLFMDECGLGTGLKERLEPGGHHVTAVEMGMQFKKISDRQFVINAGEASDYTALLEELHQGENLPTGIVHLCNITGAAGDGTEKLLNRGFYSLLYLARAIVNHHINHKIQLTVVSDNMQEVTGQENLRPEKAMVLGILKVLPQEYSNINCRSIDVDIPPGGSPEENQLLQWLATEILRESSDTVVAFRGNYRWVQTFEPVLPDEMEIAPEGTRLREKGVYLITGGLGGIGLALAESLAKSVHARLILTGRSDFPAKNQWEDWLTRHPVENTKGVSRKIRILQELEAHGAEVIALKADASSEEDMHAVINTAESHFGALHGVIHAAGILRPDIFLPVEELGKAQCQEQFLPKIQGIMVLEKVLQGRELDFCLLTSSLSSVLGGLGYTAYASANIFMDAFVYKHNRVNGLKWTSVNLDRWDTTADSAQSNTAETSSESMVIMPAQGVEVFRRILSWSDGNLHQVVVSTGDLQTRINQWVKLEFIREAPQQEEMEDLADTYVQERPVLSTPYVTPTNKMEEMIANVWSKFLGIEKIGIHDNFFELGATSLDIIQVNNKLKTLLKQSIPVVRMFEFPTVNSLAKRLSTEETGENLPGGKRDRSEEIEDGKKLLSQRLQKRLGQRQEVKR
jgi:acyl transferase domain-containing protein